MGVSRCCRSRTINRPVSHQCIMRITLLALLLFNGLSALFGGMVLMAAPDGSIIGLPLSLLSTTPFTDYLIPGIILFTVLGVGSCVGWWLAYRHMLHAVRWSQVIGLATVTWIVVQVIMIQAVDVLHIIYGATGIGMLLLAPKANRSMDNRLT